MASVDVLEPAVRPVLPAQRPAAREPTRDDVSALKLSVHHDLGAVEAAWRAFEQSADCTVFQCFDWLATWQKHVGARTSTVPAIVLGHWGPRLAFILPLATRPRGPVRVLSFLGAGLCDYNAPLLAPGFEAREGGRFPSLWAQIRELLRADARHRPDLVFLDRMPERLGTQRNPLMQLGVRLHPSQAYAMHLERDWDSTYAARRSSATRRRDRTKRKRLAESGPVRLVTAAAPDEIAATLTVLMQQKSRAFAQMGVPDLFAVPGHRDFFLDVAQKTVPSGLVHVSSLQIGSTLAAANLGIEFRGVYHHVLASYDDGPLSRFGPGAAHLHDLMQHACERQCRLFDFTIGDEPYKRDWSDREIKLFDHVAGVSPVGAMTALLLGASMRAKRTIKQTKWLWAAATRLRSALGLLKSRARPQAPSED